MSEERIPPDAPRETRDRRAWLLAGLIVAMGVGSVLYRWLVIHRLEQTSLLFIGIPLVLAIVLALTPKAKSATGMVSRE